MKKAIFKYKNREVVIWNTTTILALYQDYEKIEYSYLHLDGKFGEEKETTVGEYDFSKEFVFTNEYVELQWVKK